MLVDAAGVVVQCSEDAAGAFGDQRGRPLDGVVDPASARRVGELMLGLRVGDPPASQLLVFLRRDGTEQAVAALIDKSVHATCPEPVLRISALHRVSSREGLEELVRSEAVLRSFVQTATEAMWCIEFTEPVDLSVGDGEIVRQVFENDCHWLMCNGAMARLYDLPEGLEFNKQSVRSYFPRTPENEAFVRRIIGSDFSVDNALSIDTRHDGSMMYVENAVRCYIEGGFLLRMSGTARDVTDRRLKENRLEEVAQDVRSILSAIPDVILIIDRQRHLLAANPAFEKLLGWRAEHFLGRDVQRLIDLESPLPGGRRWYGVDPQRWTAAVGHRAGVKVLFDVQVAPIGEEAPDRFVLSMRPARQGEDPASTWPPQASPAN